jgi:hypothetical protein
VALSELVLIVIIDSTSSRPTPYPDLMSMGEPLSFAGRKELEEFREAP